ncbi:MAG: IS1595 family transposase [Patescibacteria group bacterium]
MGYTFGQFNQEFSDEKVCLDTLFHYRYGELSTCPKCQQETKFYRLKNRKVYSCLHCRYQLHPLADTIFHKSETPLTKWFFAMFLFANSKNGVSAKELERHLGVTYKTAWRIARQIRRLMSQDGEEKLSGTVEMDETLIGGYKRGDIGGNTKGTKQTVIGAVERGGRIKAKHTENRETHTILNQIQSDIEPGSKLITDEWAVYHKAKKLGYGRRAIKHLDKKYVRGIVHTNTIEGFWSQLKRSINGTYHVVSPKYLQLFVDEFSFRYNLRSVSSVYPMLLKRAARPF